MMAVCAALELTDPQSGTHLLMELCADIGVIIGKRDGKRYGTKIVDEILIH